MSDRITRPDVTLLGGNPDGSLSNLDEVDRLLSRTEIPEAYGLVYLARNELSHKDDADGGVDVAKMKPRALEVLTDGKFPFDIAAGESIRDVMERMRSDRTGVAMLPMPTAAEHAKLDALRGQLADWSAATLGGSVRKMGAAWKDYFGKDAGSWRDGSAQQITEFLTAKAETPEPAGTSLITGQDDTEPDKSEPEPEPESAGPDPAEIEAGEAREEIVREEIAEQQGPGLRSVPAPSFSGGQS